MLRDAHAKTVDHVLLQNSYHPNAEQLTDWLSRACHAQIHDKADFDGYDNRVAKRTSRKTFGNLTAECINTYSQVIHAAKQTAFVGLFASMAEKFSSPL